MASATAACTQQPHVPYQDWEERRSRLAASGVPEAAVLADGEAWRRSQNEQRVDEIHAMLDALNDALRRSSPTLFATFRARTDAEVALVGHSFGGATAAACVLRDGARAEGPRFAHCFLFDPWVGGAASPLSEHELDVRPFAPRSRLRTMRVWVNSESGAAQLAAAAASKLVHKARAAGAAVADVVRVADCGHYAQTDVLCILESGPFACAYAALCGGGSGGGGVTPAREALRGCIGETLDPLLEQGWLAVGLAPLPVS